MVLALSASISKQQRAQETSETIKRLMDLYEEREELQLEEGLKEQKREFDIVTGEHETQVLELIQGYIDKLIDILGTLPVATRLPSRQIRAAVVFRDDFNDDSSISNNWRHVVSMYGGYNGEFQVYTNKKDNVYTSNGMLYIKPTLTIDDPRYDENSLHSGSMDMNHLFGTCTIHAVSGCHRDGKDGILPPIMSGRINSVATLKYGTVTIRAKIPKGDWIWPAIWMMPKSSHYGNWPRSGEIDIMESRGNSGSYGTGHVSSTLHWGPDAGHNKFQKTTGSQYDSDWHNNFHEWKLEWTPDHLVTSIDGKQIMHVNPGSNFWNFGGFGGSNIWGSNKTAPFDQEFYMILNVAVGGTGGFFGDSGNKPWSNRNGQRQGQQDFWNKRWDWQSTWHGDNTALIVDWVEFKSFY